MKARHLAILTTALAAAATLTAPAATAASPTTAATAAAGSIAHPAYGFVGHEEGQGPTLDAAIRAAKMQMYGDYVGCQQPFIVVADGQYSDGTWWADVDANGCTGYR